MVFSWFASNFIHLVAQRSRAHSHRVYKIQNTKKEKRKNQQQQREANEAQEIVAVIEASEYIPATASDIMESVVRKNGDDYTYIIYCQSNTASII